MCLIYAFCQRSQVCLGGDLQFGEGMDFLDTCRISVTLVNSLHLMSFLYSVPLFLSWWHVTQCTKEERQPCFTCLHFSGTSRRSFVNGCQASPLPQFPCLCDEDKGFFPEAPEWHSVWHSESCGLWWRHANPKLDLARIIVSSFPSPPTFSANEVALENKGPFGMRNKINGFTFFQLLLFSLPIRILSNKWNTTAICMTDLFV